MIAALPHLYWLKTKQIINTFFLARLLFLLITQEPSLCKGLLSYASAIMFLDFKRVYISYAGILNSNLVQLLEHLQVVVNLHMVENETLLHTLTIRLPKKWVDKRRGMRTSDDNKVNLQYFVQMCALSEARKNHVVASSW